MFNYLSKILGQKKIFIVFLILIVSGIIIPTVASAAWWEYLIPGWNTVKLFQDATGSATGKAFFNAAIYVASFLPMLFAGASFSVASLLLNWVTGADFMPVSFTGFDNPAIAVGWPVARDFANMIVVLGFVVIGIATALRINDYGAKKLLPKLIIAAILINFSLVICGVFIDGSNIAAKYFVQSGGKGLTSGIVTVLDNQKGQLEGIFKKDIGQYIAQTVSLLFVYILGNIVYILFFFLFLVRYLALWVLVIFSPIAFVCYVFPFTKKFFEAWWTNFFSWCIIGLTGSFFLYLSDKITDGLIKGVGAQAKKMPIPGLDAGVFLIYLVPLAFMGIGFLFSLQTAAMGAGMITGAAKSVISKASGTIKGAAKGAAGGALKGLSDKTGLTRLGAGVKDWATRGLVGMGVMRPGSLQANQASRLNDKDRVNRVNNMTAEQMVSELTHHRVGNEARLERSLITKKLAETGRLSALPQALRDTSITEATNAGVRSRDLIGGMNSTDIANVINTNQYDAETRGEGLKTLSKRKHLDLVNPARRNAVMQEAVTYGARPEEIEAVDYHFAPQNEARRQRIRSANLTINRDPMTGANIAARAITDADIDELAMQQVLDENITSYSHDQLRNIDHRHLTGEKGARRVDRLTPDKIGAFTLAAQPVRRAVKSHFNPADPDHRLLTDAGTAWNEHRAAAARGDSATSANRLTEFRRLRSLFTAQNNVPG